MTATIISKPVRFKPVRSTLATNDEQLSVAEVLKRHRYKLTQAEVSIVGTKTLAAFRDRYPRTYPKLGLRKPSQHRRRVYMIQDWDLIINTAKEVLAARPTPPTQSNIVPMRREPNLVGGFYRSTDPADCKTFVYVYEQADHTSQSYEVFIATLINDFWHYTEDLFSAAHLGTLELLEPESARWLKANAAFVNALTNEILGARHLMSLFRGGAQ
jgi:hypothetical protein